MLCSPTPPHTHVSVAFRDHPQIQTFAAPENTNGVGVGNKEKVQAVKFPSANSGFQYTKREASIVKVMQKRAITPPQEVHSSV
jgi:hypothetical protein